MQWSKNLSMFAAVALTGTAVLAASPADAQSRNGPADTVYGERADLDAPTRLVGYRDLNLASAEGEKTLNGRVKSAVRSVCDDAVQSRDLHQLYACQVFAWGGARPQIALAVMRAREIASTGTSAILPVAITLSALPR